MDDLSLTIDTSQWDALLKALPQRVARRAVRQALQVGGDVLAEAMSAEAPLRTDVPTPGSDALPPGALKEDIAAQVQIGTRYDPRVKVGATVIASHVAWWIENGFDHVEGGRKKANGEGGKVTKHIEANAFMARTFDSTIGRAVDVMLESLATSLDQDLNSDTGETGTTDD